MSVGKPCEKVFKPPEGGYDPQIRPNALGYFIPASLALSSLAFSAVSPGLDKPITLSL